ncbi:RHS repeat-associated core domain-containing protein [Winslowiella iniecta]|uniref:RHS repeat-associated core domain-containing protein n=3 Tax=Winslowiella iniecta TaxID=1560201 RepID=UPI003B98772F
MDIDGDSQQTFWYHTDLNGLPERLTDEEGDVVWRGRFSSWGETEYESGGSRLAVPQNLRFQGQYLDRETGLHYNLFRYYDPVMGRFTQPDPVGLEGGLNPYAYAPTPLTWVDPLGLKCSHTASNPKEAHAAIRDKWGYDMAPKDMRELQATIDRIKLQRPAYDQDGSIFRNTYEINPGSQRLNTGSGPYQEWTVRTPGLGNRGARRIVVDTKTGKAYYSHDHYESFIEVVPGGWK